MKTKCFTLSLLVLSISARLAEPNDLNVGAAAIQLEADDSMVIGGSILPKFSQGQEGELRVVALVLEKPKQTKIAIVACDVLFVSRDLVDASLAEIERTTKIPASHVLVNATHTHHAPSTGTVHGYKRDEEFCKRMQQGIVDAVRQVWGGLLPLVYFVVDVGRNIPALAGTPCSEHVFR